MVSSQSEEINTKTNTKTIDSISTFEAKKKVTGYIIATFVFLSAFSNIFYLKGFKTKMSGHGRYHNIKQGEKNINIILHPENYIINKKSIAKAKEIYKITHEKIKKI